MGSERHSNCRAYLSEKHSDYRPFTELKQKEQAAYWNWRHSHPDDDHRDDHR
jgi:hypothetical protein